MNIIYSYFLYFLIYSFGGWICETIFCFIVDKQLVNRGFLNGPLCPIYGVGALMIVTVLAPVSSNIAILYFSAVALTSILEYITGFLLEAIFNLKWWDYSNCKFNIKGRVCLLNSILFGILSLVLIKLIHPALLEVIGRMNPDIVIWTCIILSIYFCIDTIVTTYKVLHLSGKLKEMQTLLEEIKEKSETYKEILQQSISKFDGLIDPENEKIVFAKEQVNKLRTTLESIVVKNKSLNRRIIKAFPNIKSLKYQYSLDKLKEEIKKIKKK